MHPAVEKTARHVNPALVRLLGVLGYGRVYTRAAGVHIWDSEGRRYLDCLAGFGALNLGHNHPKLVARIKAHLDAGPLSLCHVGVTPYAADLAAALAERAAPLEVAVFASSGGEAVEAALKIARAATGRAGVVYCDGGFHGNTLGTLSIMGEPRMRAKYEPLLGGSVAVPFGDLTALDRALGRDVGAFVVEPVQGEAGVILPPPGYLAAAADLCRRRGAIFVADEVQTGLGRTGALFACREERVVPDVLVLAKSLSGGIVPVSAALLRKELAAKALGSPQDFDAHNSTFGGNALSMAVGLATLEIIDEEKLVDNARAQGDRLLAGLRGRLAGHPLVRAVRGRGLLVGIELGPAEAEGQSRLGRFLSKVAAPVVDRVSEAVLGQWLAVKLLERGILCQPASHAWDVLKIEPPLTIAAAEIDETVTKVGDVLDEYRSVPKLLLDVGRTLGRQARKGWTFG